MTPPSEPLYDIRFDDGLIRQSLVKQYHVLPSEQDALHYYDWSLMLSGIMSDTPLGQVVAIRAEKDHKIVNKYGAHEKQIRAEWARFKAARSKKRPGSMGSIAQLQSMIESMHGVRR